VQHEQTTALPFLRRLVEWPLLLLFGRTAGCIACGDSCLEPPRTEIRVQNCKHINYCALQLNMLCTCANGVASQTLEGREGRSEIKAQTCSSTAVCAGSGSQVIFGICAGTIQTETNLCPIHQTRTHP